MGGRVLRRVLRRGFREDTQKAQIRLVESTTPLVCAFGSLLGLN